MNDIQQLVEISRLYGDDSAYVIAGGGNTSFKDDDRIWIKASGIPLAGIEKSGFVCLSRLKLREIEKSTYSEDSALREEQVKSAMKGAIISPKNLRPSVETSLHNLIDYAFVVHTHPSLVNGLMCSRNVKEEVEARFGRDALYVEYTDPGFVLFKKVQERILAYREQFGKAPAIIFLQNHGVFVAANTVEKIQSIYETINQRISSGIDLSLPPCEPKLYESAISLTIKEHYVSSGLITKSLRSAMSDHFSTSKEQYQKISRPFTPDIIVYCKSNYLFLEQGVKEKQILDILRDFKETRGYYPKVIVEERGGLIIIEENNKSIQTVLEVFFDMMKISYLSEQFGGPHFMTDEQISFIDNWEVENYRRSVAKG